MDHHWGQVDGDEDGDGAVGAIEPAATKLLLLPLLSHIGMYSYFPVCCHCFF